MRQLRPYLESSLCREQFLYREDVMPTDLYRYAFGPCVPPEEIAAALLLALWGADTLHGEACVAAVYRAEPEQRVCVIDAGTRIGQDLNRLFVGFVRRELSDDRFRIERIEISTALPAVRQSDAVCACTEGTRALAWPGTVS